MASPYRKTKKIRKKKKRASGKETKRVRRNKGTTPSVDKVLDA